MKEVTMAPTEKPWQCSHCEKRFADAFAVREHHKKKHKNKKLAKAVKDATRRDDGDESFASRAIQAELDHAMGIDNYDYDWLVEPFK
jgi:hypothetical protein